MTTDNRSTDEGTKHAVSEALSMAIAKATAGCPVGAIIIKKLVVNVYSAHGGGSSVSVKNFALRQEVKP